MRLDRMEEESRQRQLDEEFRVRAWLRRYSVLYCSNSLRRPGLDQTRWDSATSHTALNAGKEAEAGC